MARRALLTLVVALLFLPSFAAAKYEGPQTPTEPIAIAIVFHSQHQDVYEQDPEPDAPPYPQVYEHLRAALDSLHLASPTDDFFPRHDFPSSSEVVIIGYDDGARVIAPRGPLSDLSGKLLGPEKYYRASNRLGTDLVIGLEVALAELAKSPHTRRALLVIGDGNDTNDDIARTRIPDIARRAEQFGVRIHALHYRTATSSETNLFPLLTPQWRTITSLAEPLEETFRAIREEPALRPIKSSSSIHDTTEPPWLLLGFGAAIVVFALLLSFRSRNDSAT